MRTLKQDLVRMSRRKRAVLIFFMLYLGMLFFCVTWVYQADANAKTSSVDRAREEVEGQDRPITQFVKPDPQVQGLLEDDTDPWCPDTHNATRTTTFYRLNDFHYFIGAYFDARIQDKVYIRLITVRHKGSNAPIYCLVTGSDGQLHSVLAEKYPFNENHARAQLGFILSCPMKGVVDKNPCRVHVSSQPNINEDMLTLPMLSIPATRQYRSEFGVCIPPLHGDISDETLVDFVETTRQLGANHFYFYRYDGDVHHPFSNAAIQRVTKYYADKNLVTVHPWKLPFSSNSIWYNGQVLAIHHCLYQNMWKHKYLSFNDIDEFLVPQKHYDWSALMSHLDDNQHSGFQFKSAFFPPDFIEKPSVLYNVLRSSVNNVRTKCIVRPERMFEMGIHHISKWNEEKWPPVQVDAKVALLNHYRKCDPFFAQRGFHCSPREEDKTIFKYKAAIEKDYASAMKEINLIKESENNKQ